MKLKALELKRMKTNEQYRDPLAFTWANVNMSQLAIDVITYSSVGLDPVQPNHINPIPFKNNGLNKYDITFIIGYKGTEIKAKKYGLEIPDDVIVELVYKNDKFKQIKKDITNRIENYQFEIVEDFNRGELVGGFYYHKFFNNPEKNKIRVFSKAEIDKRKPDHASAEFWGGEKDEYANGRKTGNKVQVEGWYDEMAYKTIYRAAYNAITIDSEKIDQNYLTVMKRENDRVPEQVAKQIKENANAGENQVGFDETTGEVIETIPDQPGAPTADAPKEEQQQPAAEQVNNQQPDPNKKAPF